MGVCGEKELIIICTVRVVREEGGREGTGEGGRVVAGAGAGGISRKSACLEFTRNNPGVPIKGFARGALEQRRRPPPPVFSFAGAQSWAVVGMTEQMFPSE